MKKIVLFLLTLTALVPCRAQVDTDPYTTACNRMYMAYLNNPADVANLIELTLFYCDRNNPMRSYALAIKYARLSETNYIAMVNDRDRYKEASRLLKNRVTIDSVRSLKRRVEEEAVSYVRHTPSISQAELEALSSAFRGTPAVIRVVEQRRLGELYAETRRQHTLEGYRAFIAKYKGSDQAYEATKTLTRLADSLLLLTTTTAEVKEITRGLEDFDAIMRIARQREATIEYANACDLHTEEAYRAYLSRYPFANEYDQVLEQLEQLRQAHFAAIHTPRQLADFARQNPESPLAEEAMVQLRQMVRNQDQGAARIYFSTFPLDAEYGNLYRQHYEAHTLEGNSAPILKFREENPQFPYMAAVESDLIRARSKDSINLMRPYSESQFLDWAQQVRALTGKKISLVALQRTLQAHIAARDWKACDERCRYFFLSFDEVCADEYDELQRILSAPANPKYSLTSEVTPSYSMRGAALHPNGQHLYYTMQTEDKCAIQIAQKQSGKGYKWKNVGPVRFDNLVNRNLRFYNFFDNGRKMLLGQDGDILIAEYRDSVWHVIEIPTYPVNTDYQDYDAFMLPDGNGILLASDRPDGHNLQHSGDYYHGDTALASDIYYVPRSLHGWGEAINLGPVVNTPYCDHAPLLSSDLKTLYFISDGHTGLGYGDIFYCTREDVDDWTDWSEPRNYGKETNSGFDEGHLSFTPDERSLYVCSNRSGRYGLYSVAAAHTPSTHATTTVNIDAEIDTQVDIIDMSTGYIVQELSVPTTGLRLYSDKRYLIQAHGQMPNYLPAETLSPRKRRTVELHRFDASHSPSAPQPAPAIEFERLSDRLTPVAQRELDNMALFLAAHPDIRQVHILVNVPGVEDKACYDLSRARGVAIRRHLERQGVDPSRVILTAYGNANYGKGRSNPSAEVEFLW